MITKVARGWRPGGLVAYLLGPGRHHEHIDPRVVASWDGLDAAWRPARAGDGSFRLGPLIDALHAPAIAAGLPLRAPEAGSRWHGKRGYVWHCSVRNAVGDRVLSDGQWADIARELLDRAGIAARGDHGGPRWVAIRHAEDHIHIAVVLVRQDTGRRFWPHHDYSRLRAAAGELECRYGLTVTAPADRTAAHAPGRAELEKAGRRGREPARVELARAVRQAAVRAHTPEGFVVALRQRGYLVELRRAPSGDPIGYKIARRGEVTATGEPLYYGGGKLAADLSLPRLIHRWASAAASAGPAAETAAERLAVLATATERTELARSRIREAGDGAPTESPDGIAHATGDVFTAVSTLAGGAQPGGQLAAAADRYDRAARAPGEPTPRLGPVAAELRGLAWRLIALGGLRGGEQSAALALVVAVAALVVEIAAWQQARGRVHQARAAREAAVLARRWRPTTPPPRGRAALVAGRASQHGVGAPATHQRPRSA